MYTDGSSRRFTQITSKTSSPCDRKHRCHTTNTAFARLSTYINIPWLKESHIGNTQESYFILLLIQSKTITVTSSAVGIASVFKISSMWEWLLDGCSSIASHIPAIYYRLQTRSIRIILRSSCISVILRIRLHFRPYSGFHQSLTITVIWNWWSTKHFEESRVWQIFS